MIFDVFYENFLNDKTENSMKILVLSMKNKTRVCNLILANLKYLFEKTKVKFLFVFGFYYVYSFIQTIEV